jgi:hypothetical protein
MGVKDIFTYLFKEQPDSDGPEHAAPEHDKADGVEKDWAASDFDEEFYVDDEWIKENVREVE